MIGQLMLDSACGLVNLDLNPVIVGAKGEGCTVADAVAFVDN